MRIAPGWPMGDKHVTLDSLHCPKHAVLLHHHKSPMKLNRLKAKYQTTIKKELSEDPWNICTMTRGIFLLLIIYSPMGRMQTD